MTEPIYPTRLRSLDAFRGITVAAMILVNNPGEPSAVYRPLQHAAWNGCTPTDLIFPFFLFITGVAASFSFAGRSQPPPTGAFIAKVARRSAVIFALGIFLNGFPLFNWDTLRIPGVLQRIAVCSACAAFAVRVMRPRGQGLTALLLIVGYWVLMAYVPAPGSATAGFGPHANLPGYVDAVLLRGHLLYHDADPEGLLSTVAAVATTLIGVLAGHAVRSPWPAMHRAAVLASLGGAGIVIGLVMDPWCPINKQLWTSSFVVFSGGAALVGFALCHWVIDIRGVQRWATPFLVYGTNPIVAYVLSTLLAKELWLWHVTSADGSTIDAARYLFESVFLPWAQPMNASLLFAAANVAVWLSVTAVLYRQRVSIRI